MNKNIMKKIAIDSYVDNSLNEKKVAEVSKLLNRRQLKEYLKELKLIEAKNTVFVSVAHMDDAINDSLIEKLKTQFPSKRLSISEDINLIAGVRVRNNDNIYDYSLNGSFNDILSFVEKS